MGNLLSTSNTTTNKIIVKKLAEARETNTHTRESVITEETNSQVNQNSDSDSEIEFLEIGERPGEHQLLDRNGNLLLDSSAGNRSDYSSGDDEEPISIRPST